MDKGGLGKYASGGLTRLKINKTHKPTSFNTGCLKITLAFFSLGIFITRF
jgi:hypothetical protein